MPRPKNKIELIEQSQLSFNELIEYIDNLEHQELAKSFPERFLNRNVKDVLAHLHHWHLLMISWYNEGMAGMKPSMPAKDYKWRDLPALNKSIQEKYERDRLSEVRKILNTSFGEIQEIIDHHTDEDLFAKKRFNWTGTTSLGAYLISCSSSHYIWAKKLIKKCLKEVE